jgi:heat shock protein HslJ
MMPRGTPGGQLPGRQSPARQLPGRQPSGRLAGALGACLLAVTLFTACAGADGSSPAGPGESSTAPGSGPSTGPWTGPGGTTAPTTGPPATAEQLVGTWVVDTTFGSPNQPYLTIRADGSWAGSDGCNGVRGTWNVSGDGTLTVEAGPSTLIYCDGKPLPSLFANATSASVDIVSVPHTLTLVDHTGTATTLIAGREDLAPID